MTQNEQGASAPRISYCLSNFAPNEVQFLMETLATIPQPMVVTRPIYDKILSQVQAQDKAREEAAKQKQADGPGKSEPPVKPATTTAKASQAKTK